jgi:hypothetical protein
LPKRTKHSYRVNIKGPLSGQCNICGDIGPLTEDHTPPKCCRGVTAAEVHAMHSKLGGGAAGMKPKRVQAGVAFRSLCKRCNDLLGRSYDPVLGDFCSRARAATNTVLHLPDVLRVEITPQAVMRAVVGHMAAQGLDRYDKGNLTDPIREYILDDSKPLPAELSFHYWLYPFQPQVHVMDAVRMRLSDEAMLQFWLLKFFPLAFMVLLAPTEGELVNAHSLNAFRNDACNDTHVIDLRLRPIVAARWPEAPDDDGFVLYGAGAYMAESLNRIRRP